MVYWMVDRSVALMVTAMEEIAVEQKVVEMVVKSGLCLETKSVALMDIL
jgi:hypothetical protein